MANPLNHRSAFEARQRGSKALLVRKLGQKIGKVQRRGAS